MTDMTARNFVNACKALMMLGRDEFVSGGVITPDEDDDWNWWHISADPIRFMASLDDARLRRLWALIEARLPKPASDAERRAREMNAELPKHQAEVLRIKGMIE